MIEIEQVITGCGLKVVDHPTREDLIARYFESRSDGLMPYTAEGLVAASTGDSIPSHIHRTEYDAVRIRTSPLKFRVDVGPRNSPDGRYCKRPGWAFPLWPCHSRQAARVTLGGRRLLSRLVGGQLDLLIDDYGGEAEPPFCHLRVWRRHPLRRPVGHRGWTHLRRRADLGHAAARRSRPSRCLPWRQCSPEPISPWSNLETAITDRGVPAEGKAYHFRSPALSFEALKAAGVDVVGMANNHALDYGPVGMADTFDAIAASGMPVLGIGHNAAEAFRPY